MSSEDLDTFNSVGSENIVFNMITYSMSEHTMNTKRHPANLILFTYLFQLSKRLIQTSSDKKDKALKEDLSKFIRHWLNFNQQYGNPIHNRTRMEKEEIDKRQQLLVDFCVYLGFLKPKKAIDMDYRTYVLEVTSKREGKRGRTEL